MIIMSIRFFFSNKNIKLTQKLKK
uniref:Uncharacterized protein n=1 Tax=Anopheles arabiensis TaxID=7173 RepID=A0A182IHT0_ANOAR